MKGNDEGRKREKEGGRKGGKKEALSGGLDKDDRCRWKPGWVSNNL